MSQGAGGNQRIGDAIRLTKLVFRAVLCYNADNISSANMLISRLFLLQQKGIRDAGYASSVSTQILQNDDHGSVGPLLQLLVFFWLLVRPRSTVVLAAATVTVQPVVVSNWLLS